MNAMATVLVTIVGDDNLNQRRVWVFFHIFHLKNLSLGYSSKRYFPRVKLEPRHQDGSKSFIFFFIYVYFLHIQ